MRKNKINGNQRYLEHGIYHFYENILKMDTVEEVKQFASDYLMNLRSGVQRNETDGHRNVIRETIQYMEQDYQHATLYNAAEKVYIAPTYLSMLIKTNTGKTFIENLTDIRMKKAKHLLQNTSLRVYEISVKVGYQDPRYFSQIFKKRVGLTPSEYRTAVERQAQ